MNIRIDGVEYPATKDRNLLETCLGLGLNLPYFCWHPAMGSVGACRQCAVLQYPDEEAEQAGRGKLVMACMTPVSDGARFSLETAQARRFRQGIIESLMINHPHDCPVCAEGGECHLQDMTVMVGHRDRRYRGRKRTFRNQYLGPLVHHEMNRCITCYRCTRFYRDYAGGTDLAAQGCHDHIFFGRHEDGVLESEFAGNLVEVCPTGVFTDKHLVHDYTRKWDLQSAPSVCAGCAVGCNTLPGERYGRLKRVHNRFNAEINGYFLCDRGRFGATWVNDERRLDYPGLRGEDGRYNAIDHHGALQRIVSSVERGAVAAVGSPRASVEANFLLRLLAGPARFCPGFSAVEQPLVGEALALLRASRATVPDIATMETADAILVLGEDVSNTAPRIALALRQGVRNRAYAMAAGLKLQDWQDAAIRNLAQDQRCPLFIAATAATRLDPVAARSLRLATPEIARLGLRVADALAGDNSNDYSHDNSHDNPDDHSVHREAAAIADGLRDAKRLLVVSGTGSGDIAVMQAAARVAEAFRDTGREAMLSLVVPEANSLGQALLCEGNGSPDLDALAASAEAGEIDTLLVLENDLYRRAATDQVDRLLANCQRVIALDQLDNPTTSASHLAVPAASVIESEGTLVSLEGRAQRCFPVFPPHAERHPAWVWLLATLKELGREAVSDWHHFDDVTRGCAAAIPALAGIAAAAPDHRFRNHGVRVPRQPPRYSGRTAMRANVSVHEPKQPEDEESPLAFSMEGLNRDQPAALLSYVWAPGWNSNQGLHRFQADVGGPLKGGPAGIRLLRANGGATPLPRHATAAFAVEADEVLLVPRYRIFGSEALSAISPGIRELVRPACIELCAADAERLGLADGDGVQVGDNAAALPLRIDDAMAPGCAGYTAGYRETAGLAPNTRQRLRRVAHFSPPGPTVIGSDRGGRHG
ncbi:NADH-quinone oxidoreductase subunit NuoG [Parahaliea mediterranea]|uniref:NADH-quinone oxidoreductase subunit G n=1 Tax=Parahaliea mediterranea TaxID=651086 RepID=A0A939IL65_9GAMM|nr:NADH-quinone oxidoreductase subunit NuoG [Parahaliea mediterranea]MBN7795647.1 NADH-quinone oxidoreductase subunit NuoG [Parahaliea mediterranea]